jgi:hypothetical protein
MASKQIDKIIEMLVNLSEKVENLELNMVTKTEFDKAMSHIDFVMGKYKFLDDERFVSNNLISGVIDDFHNLESRVKKLEAQQARFSFVQDN